MKKFFKNLLVCFLILVLCGAAVFFIGWTSIRVSPDCVGIIKSKTGGVKKEPVRAGKFSWNWEFLLPTNTKLEIFQLKPYLVSKNVSGTLPSGELYSTLLKSSPDFSYSFDFDFSVNISAESIESLYESLVFSDQEGLERYIGHSCDSAAKMLSSEIMRRLEKDSSFQPETLTQEDLMKIVDLNEKFRGIQFSSVTMAKCSYPDFLMYKNVRSAFLSRIKDVSSALENSSGSEEDAEFMSRLKNFFNNQD